MKKLPYIFFLNLLVAVPSLQAAQCVEGNCSNGQGTVIHEDGRKYSGDFSRGVAHGRGRLQTSDGSVYEGEMKNG